MRTNNQLSNLMLLSCFLSCVFYSASYPYVYAETIKAVTHNYISFEQELRNFTVVHVIL